jgi:hypothetical protein
LGFPLLGLQNPKPYALSNAAALLTFSIHAQRSENTSKLVRPVERPNMAPSPSRLSTSDPVQLVRRGLADYPSGSLLGVVFLEVFCASPVASPFRPASPPVLRRLASKLTWRRHLRVSTDIALNQTLSSPINLREVCYLVIPSQLCGGRDAWGIFFTLRPHSTSPSSSKPS